MVRGQTRYIYILAILPLREIPHRQNLKQQIGISEMLGLVPVGRTGNVNKERRILVVVLA